VSHIIRSVSAFARDERGAEVVEYALVAGMITVIASTAIAAVGAKVLNYWKALDGSLGL
jgi:Flp pilus assembly pilin Flp